MEFDEFVLAASTASLDDEPNAREHADAVEFRLDLAAEPLDALARYDGDLPLLVTNRAEWEGGEAPAAADRIETLRTAVEHPRVEAVDVELRAIESADRLDDQPTTRSDRRAVENLIEHARDHNVSVVVSVHDFERTPDREHLDELLVAACAHGDVGKLAVTADSPDDVLDLLGATRAATAEGRCVATMAMGAAGRHSRAVTPLYGSRIGYAPVDPADATAPGQYDLATLADLLGRLGHER